MSEPSQARANRKLTRQLWLFAAGSFAFGFALVPLYDVLCDVTGYGDRSRLARSRERRRSARCESHGDRGVRLDAPDVRRVGVSARCERHADSAGQTLRSDVPRTQSARSGCDRDGRAERGAAAGDSVLSENRVFLLYAATVRAA